MHWMIEPFRRYADFSGRSRRREFWSFILFQWLVYLMLAAFVMFGSLGVTDGKGRDGIASEGALAILLIGGIVLMGLFFLATIVPNLAVAARRMQDQNQPGGIGIGLVIGGMLITFPYLIMAVFGFIDGTRGPNQYGPDPKLERQVGTIFD
jgi:uncharacterized membrane protein YhaH (DUF805 family)